MTIEDLGRQMEGLKVENRRMKALGGAALVVALGLVAMGQSVPVQDLLRVRCLEVVDEKGVARASLYSDPLVEGNAMLMFQGPKGERPIVVGEGSGGTGVLYLFDAKGTTRASLFGTPGGDAHLQFRDGGTNCRLQIGVRSPGPEAPDGVPYFRLMAAKRGMVCYDLGMPQDGQPEMQMRTIDGTMLLKVPK